MLCSLRSFLVCALLCLIQLFTARAYVLDNVQVNVTAGSGAEAKEMAMTQAYTQAFDQLRTLPTMEKTRNEDLIPLVTSVQVKAEKISSQGYNAIYAFVFNDEGLSRFAQGNTPESPTSSSASALLTLDVSFASLEEWARFERDLHKHARTVQIETLSRTSARVICHPSGDLRAFEKLLFSLGWHKDPASSPTQWTLSRS